MSTSAHAPTILRGIEAQYRINLNPVYSTVEGMLPSEMSALVRAIEGLYAIAVEKGYHSGDCRFSICSGNQLDRFIREALKSGGRKYKVIDDVLLRAFDCNPVPDKLFLGTVEKPDYESPAMIRYMWEGLSIRAPKPDMVEHRWYGRIASQ
jgi:hypothetical protein